MDDKKREDEITDISEFEKYRHYSEEMDEETDAKNTVTPPKADDEPEFEDVSSYSGDGEGVFYSFADGADESDEPVIAKKRSAADFFKANRYKNTKIIALCLVIVILLGIGSGLIYVVQSTRGADYNNEGIDINTDAEEPLDPDDHNFKAMGDVDANSLNDFLYKWANNGGEKMYSKNVINVLLCGIDSKSGKADDGGSDSMILISVNRKTKQIVMTSLLRDSWSYIKAPRSDGTYYDYYFKMNAAYRRGGPATLVETIENNFKIEIDQYIAVDFVSFPKLIDALGGVTVEVQEYEAQYIRRTSSQKNFPSGKAKLNGTQALIYSRIRHSDSDSDVSRTRRQRAVIKALIDSAKTATNGQLLNAFKQCASYLRTGYTQAEVLKLIASAYSQKWMEYEMVELMLPNEDYVDRLATYVGDQSAWVVDYALCAQKLQKAIYGETNIVLSADRVSALDLVTNKDKYTTDSNGNNNSNNDNYYNNNNNNNYNNYTPEPTRSTEDTSPNHEDEPSSDDTQPDQNLTPTEPSSNDMIEEPDVELPDEVAEAE